MFRNALLFYVAAMGITAVGWGLFTHAHAAAHEEAIIVGKLEPAPSADQVWIVKADEARSCMKASGVTLDLMAKDLMDGGVHVVAKQKVHDNKMRIQSCGADKGTLNAFLIDKRDLEKALAQGFKTTNPVP